MHLTGPEVCCLHCGPRLSVSTDASLPSGVAGHNSAEMPSCPRTLLVWNEDVVKCSVRMNTEPSPSGQVGPHSAVQAV